MKKTIHKVANGIIGTIKIGYIGITMYSILPKILESIKIQSKNINTILVDMNSKDQIDALKNGDIDVGLIRMPKETTDLSRELT